MRVSDATQAEQIARQLEGHGCRVFVLTPQDLEHELNGLIVRRVSFTEGNLHIESVDGQSHDQPWDQITTIIRGTWSQLSTDITTIKERKFSLNRAILSGGLLLMKTTKTK